MLFEDQLFMSAPFGNIRDQPSLSTQSHTLAATLAGGFNNYQYSVMTLEMFNFSHSKFLPQLYSEFFQPVFQDYAE